VRPAFTDTHVHFHDLREPHLRYDWLEHGQPVDEEDGDIGAIRAERYWPDDLHGEARFHGVERVIHVQAAIGAADPVEETRWLQAHHDRFGWPHGAIAYADLTSPGLEDILQGHLEFPIVRGIRDLPRAEDALTDPRWETGFARLGELGLICCDAPTNLERYADAAALARRNPDTVLCIDHLGTPARTDAAHFAAWRRALAALAAEPNVVLKISGFPMVDHQWTIGSMRPWVLAGIEAFGVERCFFGTNWPLDRLRSSYGDLVGAYAEIVADFTPEEQRALLSGNARRVFRV
jgi:predicted TIM-barrel fold metal-dependent hydrolase